MTSQAAEHQDDVLHNPQSKTPASARHKALAIPELRSHIATFLETKDILSLIQT
ncbi:hypothetical protein BGZ93_003343, partial [Podila epicladia]